MPNELSQSARYFAAASDKWSVERDSVELAHSFVRRRENYRSTGEIPGQLRPAHRLAAPHAPARRSLALPTHFGPLARNSALLRLLALLFIAGSVRAADWPEFLGPARDNTSPETGLFETLG